MTKFKFQKHYEYDNIIILKDLHLRRNYWKHFKFASRP